MPVKAIGDQEPLLPRANIAVAEIVRQSILVGDIEPGERIKEEDLAEALGVSRTPVREALLVLAAEKLVDLPRNRGARATVRTLDEDELAVIYDMRALLEGYGTGRVAERIDKKLLSELEDSCDRLAATPTGEIATLVDENNRFHRLILDAADSDRFAFLVGTLLQVPFAYKFGAWADESFHRMALSGHLRVVRALRDKDPDAAEQAMRQHLDEVAADARIRKQPVSDGATAVSSS
ncbi:MAG: GntR family transcriptional regulator [Actinobacteria bacterium]|nr:GntR family transcriptional regulator [Actinomycetota bacterium]